MQRRFGGRDLLLEPPPNLSAFYPQKRGQFEHFGVFLCCRTYLTIILGAAIFIHYRSRAVSSIGRASDS